MKARVRIGKQPPKDLPTAIVSGNPPKSLSVRLASQADLRAIGEAFKPHAHALADYLVGIAAHPSLSASKVIPISRLRLGEIALLLWALPGPRRGRPRKPSTDRALKLTEAGEADRRAAIISALTGENPENLRNRLRSLKSYKPKGK